MDGGHVAALDAGQVQQHLGHGGEAVGGARAVGDDKVVGGQAVVIDTVDDGLVGAVAGGGDQHPLGAGVQVSRGLVALGEEPGALQGDVDAQVLMRQLGRIADRRDLDLAAAGVDRVAVHRDDAREPTMHAVVPQQMGVGLDGAQVVDGDDLDVGAVVLDDGAQDQAANAAEPVDGDANGHDEVP